MGQPSSGQGLLGVREGFLPHVGDAIERFDEAWSQTSRITTMKCWISFTCFPNEQALPLEREILMLSVQAENVIWLENDDQQTQQLIDPAGIALDDLISESESRHIPASVSNSSLLDITQNPERITGRSFYNI